MEAIKKTIDASKIGTTSHAQSTKGISQRLHVQELKRTQNRQNKWLINESKPWHAPTFRKENGLHHIGDSIPQPQQKQMLELLSKPNMYVKTSACM